ncbi:Hypothetical protein NTJ_00792 [Nesidiocoris tenuis]|uniref:Secreted protein n=1 Tax=Nesidiocoris tenuis TaxID=355587 RepID=A0ABN7A6Y7_9HEMI|nr:Hypothetical protein NTJ_00792 [Nesidiocoris tenuis]
MKPPLRALPINGVCTQSAEGQPAFQPFVVALRLVWAAQLALSVMTRQSDACALSQSATGRSSCQRDEDKLYCIPSQNSVLKNVFFISIFTR